MTLYALDQDQPRLAADTWVAPDAILVGKVIVETAASVWFGATLRADHEEVRIGRGSNVQEHVVMHVDAGFPLTVGEDCTIGHKAMLHGCTIGRNTLIGMGATVLNGAVIGENCLIGAGALITEGKHIPDNSLVMGAPGKIVREVDATLAAKLTQSALTYQNNMRRFRSDLRPC